MGRARGGGPKGLSTAETNARSLGSSPPCPPRKAGRVNRSPQSGEGHRMTGGAVSPLPIHGEGQGGEAQRHRCSRAKRKRPRFVPTLPSPQAGRVNRGPQSGEGNRTNGCRLTAGWAVSPLPIHGEGQGGGAQRPQYSRDKRKKPRFVPTLPSPQSGEGE